LVSSSLKISQEGGRTGGTRGENFGFRIALDAKRLRRFHAAHRGSTSKKPRGPPVLSSSLLISQALATSDQNGGSPRRAERRDRETARELLQAGRGGPRLGSPLFERPVRG